MSHEYEGTRRIVYGGYDADFGQPVFVPVCRTCGRLVKADPDVTVRGDGKVSEPNATCKKCGRTSMLFEGFI